MTSWLRGIVRSGDVDLPDTVQVYRRTLEDRAAAVENAQRLVTLKLDELARARRQLADETEGFVDACRERGLPVALDVRQVEQ